MQAIMIFSLWGQESCANSFIEGRQFTAPPLSGGKLVFWVPFFIECVAVSSPITLFSSTIFSPSKVIRLNWVVVVTMVVRRMKLPDLAAFQIISLAQRTFPLFSGFGFPFLLTRKGTRKRRYNNILLQTTAENCAQVAARPDWGSLNNILRSWVWNEPTIHYFF